LAEAFLNSGVNVTIIQRNARLIPREEKESSHLLKKMFEEKGIKVLTDTLVEKVE
jgi:pyruvate/2-oxoglutarate dehydrogenase complex dihydrolipoamide dehydrogenase (E3) component